MADSTKISRSKFARLREVFIPHLKTGQVTCYYSGQHICSRQSGEGRLVGVLGAGEDGVH